MNISKELKKLLPEYDEYSLFVMVLATIPISVLAYPDLHPVIQNNDIRTFFVIIYYFIGFFLVVKHTFSKRKKTRTEKDVLFFFGFITQVAVGIAGSIYTMNNEIGFFKLFPILNLAYCGILIILFRFEYLDGRYVTDDDISNYEIIIAIFSTLTLYLVSHYLFNHYWAITFSIIMIYAVNARKLSVVIINLFKNFT